MSMTRTILIVEDNRELAHLLEIHLRDLDYRVEIAADGASGLAKAEKGLYDLIILDLMLPGVDGLEICKRIRSGPSYVPILILTSKTSELDRVLGLELGADDYVTKPFSIMELLARVKALFRRIEHMSGGETGESERTIHTGDMTINPEKRTVSLNNTPIDTTAKEFDLLLHFARHPGRVFTRSQLLDTVWGYGHEGYEHTVNSHINRLRSKIEKDPARPRYILTVWGVGYKFADFRKNEEGSDG
jgi:two-component system OmpR family response regulator